jgi:thioredoxin 1
MASPNVIELTESNFDEHVKSGTLVVADFWAPWCGPCRALTPIIDRIADQFAGKVKVGKLNVDENPNIAVRYDVMTIPRVLFFKGSETPVHQEIGVLPETELVRLINQHQASRLNRVPCPVSHVAGRINPTTFRRGPGR